MGRRSLRTSNKIVVVGIFLACCFALYCLILKINRLVELSEMDRAAIYETVITTVTYLNSSFSGESSASLNFIFHSQTEPPLDLYCDSRNPVGKLTSPLTTQLIGPPGIYLGTCDVLEPGFSVELKNEEFRATLDPELTPSRRRSVACLSLALLFEDVDSLEALLKHYSKEVDTVEIYVSSWHDAALKVTEKYPNVHVIWWPFLHSTRRQVKQGRIHLDADSYYQTVEGSFADCWLRNAPLVENISLIDMGGWDFHSGSKRKRFANVTDQRREGWRVRTITRGVVKETTDNSLTLSESCSGRCGQPSTTADKPSFELSPNNSIDRLVNSRAVSPFLYSRRPLEPHDENVSQIPLKRVGEKWEAENSYQEDVKRCTSFRGHYSKKRKLSEKVQVFKDLPDPCLFRSHREDFRCRVASQITKRMFSGNTKVSVVQKRSMLRFSDGCR